MNRPLSESAIRRALPSGWSAADIEVVEHTGSTNADLLLRLQNLDRPLLYLAEVQTAGRGRAGRSWQSEPGGALTFSLAWPFQRPMHGLLGLPLAVGVAVAAALARFDVHVQLKWPNDVLLNDAKLAGMLIETAHARRAGQSAGSDESMPDESAASAHRTWAVIGIGINIAMTAQRIAMLGREVGQMPSLLGERNALMATLLTELTSMLTHFERTGFLPFAERWNALHAWNGKPVSVIDQGRVLESGIACGVDSVGRLLLETDGGQRVITAGDVSLRKKEAP